MSQEKKQLKAATQTTSHHLNVAIQKSNYANLIDDNLIPSILNWWQFG